MKLIVFGNRGAWGAWEPGCMGTGVHGNRGAWVHPFFKGYYWFARRLFVRRKKCSAQKLNRAALPGGFRQINCKMSTMDALFLADYARVNAGQSAAIQQLTAVNTSQSAAIQQLTAVNAGQSAAIQQLNAVNAGQSAAIQQLNAALEKHEANRLTSLAPLIVPAPLVAPAPLIAPAP